MSRAYLQWLPQFKYVGSLRIVLEIKWYDLSTFTYDLNTQNINVFCFLTMSRVLISYIFLQTETEFCGKLKTQERLLTTGQWR